MERLTNQKLSEIGHVLCNYKDENCNDNCMYSTCPWREKALLRLKEYEDLEEQGKLLRLPCKVGDIVYFLWECNDNQIVEMEVIEIALYKYVLKKQTNFNAIYKLAFLNREGAIHFCDDDFGKTVFLTQAEAQAALEKMEGENKCAM